jgi:serine/threonine protein kinase/Flp pilus assembly protein TadD
MPPELNEDRLGELLLRWDELRRQGCDVTAVELCTECPELLEELNRRIEAVRNMDSVLGIEDTALVSKPPEQDPLGAGRTLPEALRAAAVFQPQRYHAHGGLGEVLIARQHELDRLVALKRIRPEKLHEQARYRFLREAAITARLQHPGIVPIYGLGQDDDGPFYTMPFIQGQTLQEAIEGFHGDDSLRRDPGRGSLELRGLLQQWITVCNTVAYAHDQGIMHRDLKPSNIMLGPYGETLVMDWGLAKPFSRDGRVSEPETDAPSPSPSPEDLTVEGTVLGTPRYMSPEQARGQPAGPASDIFSLGLILHAILTGKSAFDEASLLGADPLAAVRAAAVVPPRRRKSSVPRALEAICLKALSARPEDRYASPRTLADDVTRWLADLPVTAWREPWPDRVRRWAKRHRTAVAATAAGCAAALVLGGIGLYSYQRQVRQETASAEAALARAEQSRSDARLAWSERLDATAWGLAEDRALAAAALDSRRLPSGVHERLQSLSERVKAEAGAARADESLLNDLAAVRAARNDHPHYVGSSEYGRVFNSRGLSSALGAPASTAATLRKRPGLVAIQIASYLDDWSLVLRIDGKSPDQADRITDLARALDPDAWRNRLRDAVSLPDQEARRLAVLRLAAEHDVAAQPSPTVTLLATALREAGEPGPAISLLESARFRYRDVPWIHQELGLSLRAVRPPRREAALRAFTAATTLRPEMGFELARALRDSGQTVEAISVLQEVALRRPEAIYFYELALMKSEVSGVTAEAKELYQRAIASSRSRVSSGADDFDARRQLGLSLYRLGDLAGAVTELRQATRLRPDYATAPNDLGFVLLDSKDWTGGIAELRAAIRLNPAYAEARTNLGLALHISGDTAGAIAELHEAIRLKPDLAQAHDTLGFFLFRLGDLAGAIAADREAIRLKPDSAQAHYNLGAALDRSGDRAGAIVELQEVARLQPNDPRVQFNLGQLLGLAGRFQEALVAMERADALGAQQPEWRYPSADWVKQYRREVELEAKLSKFLSGQDRPADAAERAELASIAGRKGLHAASARLLAEAFAERPALAEDPATSRRYNAACSAALAGCGKGQDKPPPGPADRNRFRALALAWLHADLTAWAEREPGNQTPARAATARVLRHWQNDADLAGVRDLKELAKLAEPERREWQSLWAQVDVLLHQAEERAARPPGLPAGELPANAFAR